MTVKFLKEEYQKKYDVKLQEFLKIKQEFKQVFLQAKRELDKYEKELYVEEDLSFWFFGNAKEDFGYAIWHICDKSSPTTNWNAEIIELMVKRGADINHVCEGKTPLDFFTSPLDFYINDKPQQYKSTENDRKKIKELKKDIEILRKLGALTKEELDNQNK